MAPSVTLIDLDGDDGKIFESGPTAPR